MGRITTSVLLIALILAGQASRAGTIWVFDDVSGALITEFDFDVDAKPIEMLAFGGGNHVFVGLDNDTVEVRSGANGDLLSGPHQISGRPAAMVGSGSHVWVAMATKKIKRFQGTGAPIAGELSLPGKPIDMIWAEDNVWVAVDEDGEGRIIRLTGTGAVGGTTINLAAKPVALLWINPHTWVALENGTVQRYVGANQAGEAIEMPDSAKPLAMNQIGNTIWVALDSGKIQRFDPEDATPLDDDPIVVGDLGSALRNVGRLVHEGELVWVVRDDAKIQRIFDVEGELENSTIDLPANAESIIVVDDVWVAVGDPTVTGGGDTGGTGTGTSTGVGGGGNSLGGGGTGQPSLDESAFHVSPRRVRLTAGTSGDEEKASLFYTNTNTDLTQGMWVRFEVEDTDRFELEHDLYFVRPQALMAQKVWLKDESLFSSLLPGYTVVSAKAYAQSDRDGEGPYVLKQARVDVEVSATRAAAVAAILAVVLGFILGRISRRRTSRV